MADYRVAAVDIAAARPSTVVLLDGRRAEEWFAATSVGEATEWLLARKPDVIAIDAPCSTSHGLLSKGKDGAKPYAGRVCDLKLMKRGCPCTRSRRTGEHLSGRIFCKNSSSLLRRNPSRCYAGRHPRLAPVPALLSERRKVSALSRWRTGTRGRAKIAWGSMTSPALVVKAIR